MDVAEEILQQFAWHKSVGGFKEGLVSHTGRSQGDSFILKHGDDSTRGDFETVHPKVIGEWCSQAFQEEVKIRNEFTVLFK
jgi:hypothetical protein